MVTYTELSEVLGHSPSAISQAVNALQRKESVAWRRALVLFIRSRLPSVIRSAKDRRVRRRRPVKLDIGVEATDEEIYNLIGLPPGQDRVKVGRKSSVCYFESSEL